MASFSAPTSTSNSINATVTGLNPGYAGVRAFEWYLNGSLVTTTTTPAGSSEAYFTYQRLAPNTWYHLDVKIYNEDKSTLYASLSTDGQTAPAPVEPWYWNSAELNAFNGKGNFSVLTAARWNQFCDRINATCIAARSSWTTTYTTLSGAKASGSGATLTAAMFNSARLNIGSRVSTGIPEVYTGGTIYGWYFVTLQDKLNQWIASL